VAAPRVPIPWGLGALPLAALSVLAACGGSRQASPPASTTTTRAPPATTTTAGPATGGFRVTIEAATHRPKANEKWPVTVRAADAAGEPVAGTLTMRVLFGGTPVGQIDDGRVYRFVGVWREKPGEEITWPDSAVGQPLAFEALVTSHGVTRTARYAIEVRG
jgi:hypothetical protein